MRAEDWLKLLDNYRTSPVSARYHNKVPICKTLIITSVLEPLRFFDACASTESEDLNQFIRRITASVQVFSVDEHFPNSRVTLGEIKKVAPYDYNFQEMRYSVVEDGGEYSPLQAVKRLLQIVEGSALPAPPPFPANWEKEIFEPLELPAPVVQEKQERLPL